MTNKPSIVFAHGIWADGSCFQKLIPTLQAEGHDVMAAQYGLDTLKGDVDATIAAFGRVSGPIVLVGHSYGGTVITKAGVDPRVAALVYIAALGPDESETSQSLQARFPTTDVFQNIDVADGRVWLNRSVASRASPAICLPKSRASSMRPPPRRLPACSPNSWTASPGGQSRAGASWPPRIARSIRIWNGSARSAWAPPPSS